MIDVKEALRLLRKISDLAYDADVGDPLDCAIGYANKAIAALAATPAVDMPPCPVCHNPYHLEGAERYWEARWRDEKAENDRLRATSGGEVLEMVAKIISEHTYVTDTNEPDEWEKQPAVNQMAFMHCATEVIEALAATPASPLRGRDVVIGECARLIEENQETCSETADGTRRHLTPRKMGNLAGLAYADGIRALLAASPPEQASPLRGRGDVQTLLDLLNPLHGELDRQTCDARKARELPPDYAHEDIGITDQMECDLTKAVLILEKLRASPPEQPATTQPASPDIIGVLKSVHSALDDALCDMDMSHIENDDELRDVALVQWAEEWLAHAIELLSATPPEQPAAAPVTEMLDTLKKIEYALRKDSLTDHERIASARALVCAAISKAEYHATDKQPLADLAAEQRAHLHDAERIPDKGETKA